jgi:hypothetical protein
MPGDEQNRSTSMSLRRLASDGLQQVFRSFFLLERGPRCILLILFTMPFVLFSVALFATPPGRVGALSCAPAIDCSVFVDAALAMERATLLPLDPVRTASGVVERPLTLLDDARAENRRLQAALDAADAQLLNASADCRQELQETQRSMEELRNNVAESRKSLEAKTAPIIAQLEASLANVTALYEDMKARYNVAIESVSCNNALNTADVVAVDEPAHDDDDVARRKKPKQREDRNKHRPKPAPQSQLLASSSNVCVDEPSIGSVIVAEWLNKTSDPPTWQGTIKGSRCSCRVETIIHYDVFTQYNRNFRCRKL